MLEESVIEIFKTAQQYGKSIKRFEISWTTIKLGTSEELRPNITIEYYE